jgi:hypothetical protein
MTHLIRRLRPARVSAAVALCALALSATALTARAAGSHAARPAAASPCASGTDNWLDTQGSGAAGTDYFTLEFTNLSGHACTLEGYPGVSAVDLHGVQIGAAASRSTAAAHLVTLANGATAVAQLAIANTGNFTPSACRAVTAAGLRVYAPNQTGSDVIPYPFSTCSKSATVSLHVQPVKAP